MVEAAVPAPSYTGTDYIRDQVVPLWNRLNAEAMKHLEYKFLLTSIFGEKKRIGLKVFRPDGGTDEFTFDIEGGEVIGFESGIKDPRVMVIGKPYVKLLGEPLPMHAIYEIHSETIEDMVRRGDSIVENPFQYLKELFAEVELRLSGVKS